MYELPTTLYVGGKEYAIRSDYRAVLDIITALSDIEYDNRDKAVALLGILYVDFNDIPDDNVQEAIDKGLWFINCGDDSTGQRKRPRLMDWQKDFKWIINPINKAAGCEVRSVEYMHWWTFIGYYYEIGDCMFAQIVNIRNKKAKGKKLDKSERDFYRENREVIDLKQKFTQEEDELLDSLLRKE